MSTNSRYALLTIAGVSLADNQGRVENGNLLDDEFISEHTIALDGTVHTKTIPRSTGQIVTLRFNIFETAMDALKAALKAAQSEGTSVSVTIDSYPAATINVRIVTTSGLYNFESRSGGILRNASITVIKV